MCQRLHALSAFQMLKNLEVCDELLKVLQLQQLAAEGLHDCQPHAQQYCVTV